MRLDLKQQLALCLLPLIRKVVAAGGAGDPPASLLSRRACASHAHHTSPSRRFPVLAFPTASPTRERRSLGRTEGGRGSPPRLSRESLRAGFVVIPSVCRDHDGESNSSLSEATRTHGKCAPRKRTRRTFLNEFYFLLCFLKLMLKLLSIFPTRTQNNEQ